MVLYRVLAADPATPASVLRRIHHYAADLLARSRSHTSRSWDGQRTAEDLLTGLAVNPMLPADVDQALERSGDPKVLKALLERPGRTVPDAIRLLAHEKRLAVLRHAIQVIPDPDGTLAAFTQTQCAARYLDADTIAATGTSEDARVNAARRLARHHTPPAADVERVLSVARRHPDLAADLLTDTVTPAALTEKLTPLVAAQQATVVDPVPGEVTVAALAGWLAAAGRTVGDVVAYLRAEPREKLVIESLTRFPDPTGTLTREALAGPAARTGWRVSSAALLAPETAPAVRHDAARSVLARNPKVTRAQADAIGALVRADVAFAAEVVTLTRDLRLLQAAGTHRDLPSAAVTAICGVLHAGPATASAPERVADLDWLWAATHPNATLAQRTSASDRLVERLDRFSAQFTAVQRLSLDTTSWLRDWAAAGVAECQVGPVAAALEVPASALTYAHSLDRLVGVTTMVATTLATVLDRLEDDMGAAVLTALAADFAGTLGELVETVSAIVVPAARPAV